MTESNGSNETDNSNGSSGRSPIVNWVIIGAIVVVALLAVFWIMNRNGSDESDAEPAPTEVTAESDATEVPAVAATEPASEPTAEPAEEPTTEPEEEPAAEGEQVPADDLQEALANMTYSSEFTQAGTAPLEDGKYEEEAAPGSATKTEVMLLPEYTAFGELNGQPSAAVILATDPGGSGTFIDLAVVTEQDGVPTNVATTNLGDRVQINSVAIQDNQIVVDMVNQGPDDPMCCPTQQVVQTYELQEDQLVLADSQVIGTVEAATEEGEQVPADDLQEALANMTYSSEFTQAGTAPLEDGKYEEEAAPGSATKTEVMLLPEYTALGELNGQPAAAVILATDPGGSGTFIDLAVVTEQDGVPTNVATTNLGDRVRINSVAIQDNQIVVDMVNQGPDDPMCCPTQQVAQTYELQEDQLVLADSQVIGTVEAGPEESAGPDPVAPDSEAPPVELPEAEAQEPSGAVIAELGVNVRTGPGTAYPIIGVAPQGTVGEIIGKSEDGEWWVAQAPSAPNAQGWVAAAYVEATNVEEVPVIPAPPLPEAPVVEDAALADEEPYEVAEGVILYSASRVVQEGNRVYELEDVYVVPAAPDSVAELVANNAMQPALSPDRQTLAFRSLQSDKLGLGGYDLNTGERLRFSQFNEDSLPRWSPNSDRIVFASDRQGDRKWRVYITDAVAHENPADMTDLELGFGEDPDWHPSEELLIIKGCNDEGQQCGLYTMPTDGSERTLFSDEPSDARPRWIPDGSGVVFMSEGRDGNWELYRANSEGGDITRLTEDPALDGLPAVSPDGQQIAFISNRGGAWGLWVIPIAGGEATLITPIEGELPDWLIQAVDWPG